jgi:arginine repressor
MSLSESQRQNLIVKLCPKNPNKSKSETVEHFKLLGFKILTTSRTIKMFEKLEKVERK